MSDRYEYTSRAFKKAIYQERFLRWPKNRPGTFLTETGVLEYSPIHIKNDPFWFLNQSIK